MKGVDPAQMVRLGLWIIGLSVYFMLIDGVDFVPMVQMTLFFIGLGIVCDTIYTAMFVDEEKKNESK